ncbi:MAG: hypothetical protein WCR52_06155 [Bacteroidota bacterium]
MKLKNFGLAVCYMLTAAASVNAQSPIKGAATDEKFANTTVVYKDSTATDLDVLSRMDNSIGMGDVVRITVAPPKPAPAPVVPLKSSSISNVAVKSSAASISVSKPTPALASAGKPTPTPVSAGKPSPALASAGKSTPTPVSAGKPVASTIVAVKPVAKPVPSRTVVSQPVLRPQNQNPTDLVASTDGIMLNSVSQTSYKNINVPLTRNFKNDAPVNVVKNKDVETLNAPAVVVAPAASKAVAHVSSVKSVKSAKSYKKSSKKSSGWTLFAPKMKKHGKQRYNCYKF